MLGPFWPGPKNFYPDTTSLMCSQTRYKILYINEYLPISEGRNAGVSVDKEIEVLVSSS